MKNYILVGHTPFETKDMKEWALWFEHSGHERVVRQDQVGSHRVSTVFTGIDYRMGGVGLPLLFETAVFNDQGSLIAAERTRSWEEAERTHKKIMKKMRSANLP